jgi:hypothetical protein
MTMALKGQTAAQALHPVQSSLACSTQDFLQCSASRLKSRGSHTATHRPQPVQ